VFEFRHNSRKVYSGLSGSSNDQYLGTRRTGTQRWNEQDNNEKFARLVSSVSLCTELGEEAHPLPAKALGNVPGAKRGTPPHMAKGWHNYASLLLIWFNDTRKAFACERLEFRR